MIDSGDYNFSFSGLKTAVRYLIPGSAGFRPALSGILPESLRACADVRGRMPANYGLKARAPQTATITTRGAQQHARLVFAAEQMICERAQHVRSRPERLQRRMCFTR